jgi:glutamate--cysteine ligase
MSREQQLDGLVRRIETSCFVLGETDRVGVELEWIVTDPSRPRSVVPIPRTQKALADAGISVGEQLGSGAVLSFEPGGQLELSSAPEADIGGLAKVVEADRTRIFCALDDAGLGVLPSGVDLQRSLYRQLDSARYSAMETYFDRRGVAGRAMMFGTAAVQVNLDAGRDEADLIRRWRLLHGIGPALVAAFANSPGDVGRFRGWKSTRQEIWRHIDPARTAPVGRPGHVVDRRGLVRDWASYAAAAPVILRRLSEERGHDSAAAYDRAAGLDGRSTTAVRGPSTGSGPDAVVIDPGYNISTWMDTDDPPTTADLDLHLSTLFPPVRPRRWLEVRYLDCQPSDGWLVPVAVAYALITEPDVTSDVIAGYAGTDQLWEAAAHFGVQHPDLGRAARRLFDIAVEVLAVRADDLLPSVKIFQERYVDQGRCPGDDRGGVPDAAGAR